MFINGPNLIAVFFCRHNILVFFFSQWGFINNLALNYLFPPSF